MEHKHKSLCVKLAIPALEKTDLASEAFVDFKSELRQNAVQQIVGKNVPTKVLFVT